MRDRDSKTGGTMMYKTKPHQQFLLKDWRANTLRDSLYFHDWGQDEVNHLPW